MPTSPFFTDQVFESFEELMKWVKNTAFSLGYVIALMSYLKDKHFLIEYSVNDFSNELENLFFIHPKSLDIWCAFPHVLLIDATYKTNKYNMPFVEIVGVTSTNKTFSIALAFIMNEKKESYDWVLPCLRSTLENCMHPRVIVTDTDLALMNACRVFPNAARLLCRWHITENIRKNCRTLFNQQDEWDSFRAMWTILVDSPTLSLVYPVVRKFSPPRPTLPNAIMEINLQLTSQIEASCATLGKEVDKEAINASMQLQVSLKKSQNLDVLWSFITDGTPNFRESSRVMANLKSNSCTFNSEKTRQGHRRAWNRGIGIS
ncbi:hypothetical protein LXL04_016718 [Taraxacum kok-saghyz]